MPSGDDTTAADQQLGADPGGRRHSEHPLTKSTGSALGALMGWASGLKQARRRRAHSDDDRTGPDHDSLPLDLLEFLRMLGVAMCDAGDGAHQIEHQLELASHAYGHDDMRFFVLPTGVLVRIDGTNGEPLTDFSPTSSGKLRLDQVAAVYRLAGRAEKGIVDPVEGIKQISAIRSATPSRSTWQQVIGTGLLSLGLGLVLNPVAQALPWYFGLGILVGVGQLLVERRPRLLYAAPLLAAIIISALSVQFAAPLTGDDPLRLLVPTLVTFLPGAALTMAMVELSAGESVAGTARLGQGLAQLALLAFGAAVALSIIDEPDSTVTATSLGDWAPWCGAVIFAFAASWAYVAPHGSAKWFAVVVLAVTAGQQAGQLLLNSELSGFVGGLVLAPVAFWLSGRANGPPAMVVFQPGFLVLVPGGLALTGATELASSGTATNTDVFSAAVSVLAIALGVLVSSAMLQSPRKLPTRSDDLGVAQSLRIP